MAPLTGYEGVSDRDILIETTTLLKAHLEQDERWRETVCGAHTRAIDGIFDRVRKSELDAARQDGKEIMSKDHSARGIAVAGILIALATLLYMIATR